MIRNIRNIPDAEEKLCKDWELRNFVIVGMTIEDLIDIEAIICLYRNTGHAL